MMKIYPIEIGKFSSLGSLTFAWFFSYNLRFTWLLVVKLIPLESRCKEISNEIWITKIELEMRKLWPLIMIMNIRNQEGLVKMMQLLMIMIVKCTRIHDHDHAYLDESVKQLYNNRKTFYFT